MKQYFKETYVLPQTDVLTMKLEFNLLAGSINGLSSTRSGYGTASESDGTIQSWE